MCQEVRIVHRGLCSPSAVVCKNLCFFCQIPCSPNKTPVLKIEIVLELKHGRSWRHGGASEPRQRGPDTALSLRLPGGGRSESVLRLVEVAPGPPAMVSVPDPAWTAGWPRGGFALTGFVVWPLDYLNVPGASWATCYKKANSQKVRNRRRWQWSPDRPQELPRGRVPLCPGRASSSSPLSV